MIAGEVDLTTRFHLGGFAERVASSRAYPESELNWRLVGNVPHNRRCTRRRPVQPADFTHS